MSTDGFTRRCVLYRHYDDQDVLLYVGISESPIDRTNGHARSSEWVQYAARAEMEWMGSRGAAEAAEREAIRDEVPVFNRQHARGDVERRISDYIRDREIRRLREIVEIYQGSVQGFLERLTEDEVLRAETWARKEYEFVDKQIDEAYLANVLRHAGRGISSHDSQVRDDLRVEIYHDIVMKAAEQLEPVKERQEQRRAAAAHETPF
jgi:hypothetical protein